ncbi:TrkA C-terminal domain-containing protein [Vibrio lentus]|nr:TrkA C-terminal domain-containing protein [Vibrio lentus]
MRRGVYIAQLSRMGHDISTPPETELHLGDEITLVGQKEDLAKVVKNRLQQPARECNLTS